jgi:hypothetical protein
VEFALVFPLLMLLIVAIFDGGRLVFAYNDITNAARTISTVGGSLRDVQILAGHSTLSTNQRYIEADAEAQRRVVDLV